MGCNLQIHWVMLILIYILGQDTKDKTNYQPFKYFVGHGNNSVLVLQALKRRFWWVAGWREEDDWEDYNFIWTQWRRNTIINSLHQEKDLPFPTASTISKKTNGSKSDDWATWITENPQNDNTSEEEKEECSKSQERNFNSSQRDTVKVQPKAIHNTKGENLAQIDPSTLCENTLYNHLEGNFHLSNKKALLYNMKSFWDWKGENVFDYLPETYHIKEGLMDAEFIKFEKHYHELDK